MQPTSFSKSLISGAKTLFTGSEPNFYLEHKISSAYHTQGEKQAIILDEITLGRAGDCNVRFDESFSHVSRYHARILRKDNKWTLVHLSKTNKTFLNGKPVDGEWFLQDGDEIQLADNGPKLVFRLPAPPVQGAKSEFGMTARFDQFKQQVVRPYRTWLCVISGILVAVIIAVIWLGIVSYLNSRTISDLNTATTKLHNDMKLVKEQLVALDSVWSETNDRVNKCFEQYDDLYRKVKKNTKNIQQMNLMIDSLAFEYDYLKKESEKLELEITLLQQTDKTLSSQIGAVQDSCKRLTVKTEKLDSITGALTKSVKTNTNAIEKLEKNNKAIEVKINRIDRLSRQYQERLKNGKVWFVKGNGNNVRIPKDFKGDIYIDGNGNNVKIPKGFAGTVFDKGKGNNLYQ